MRAEIKAGQQQMKASQEEMEAYEENVASVHRPTDTGLLEELIPKTEEMWLDSQAVTRTLE
jgi:uncharacterized membrane protein (DUF106 family)